MLDEKEKAVIHDALATLAQEQIRLQGEESETVIKSVRLSEAKRQVQRIRENLASLLGGST
jgi:hypothetical protein